MIPNIVSAAIRAIVLAAQWLSQLVVSAKDSPKPDEKREILAAYIEKIKENLLTFVR
jgi:cystathionine beta-lyase family protein involved in aluminum resistance